MQYGHGLPTRPAYYDRQPVARAVLVGPILQAPHGTLVHWSYTVPSGKLAWIDGAVASIIRSGAPGVLAYALAEVLYTGVATGAHTCAYADCFSAALGDHNDQNIGASGVMVSGDTLQGIDSDGSTGGSTITVESCKVFEFNV